MTVRKQVNGKWLFEKYLDGGRSIRKMFATKGEALAYESYIEEQAATKPWIAKKQDCRRLSVLLLVLVVHLFHQWQLVPTGGVALAE